MKLVAVVIAYWPERYDNIPTIVKSILRSTIVPDNIIVFNNNPLHNLNYIPTDKRVSVIQTTRNFTSRSKYAVAMLEPADYYILIDDDIAVMPNTIEAFVAHAKPGYSFCDYGVVLNNNYLSASPTVKGTEITSPIRVDAFIGRFQFISFGGIVKFFQAEEKIRLPNLPLYRSVGEDILIAMCNYNSYVIPLAGDQQMSHVSEGDVGMQHDWGYYAFRDQFTFQARKLLGLQSWSKTYIPGEADHEKKAIEQYLEILALREGEISPRPEGPMRCSICQEPWYPAWKSQCENCQSKYTWVEVNDIDAWELDEWGWRLKPEISPDN